MEQSWHDLGSGRSGTWSRLSTISMRTNLPRRSRYILGNLVRTRIRLGENDESVVAQLKELLFMETQARLGRLDYRSVGIGNEPYVGSRSRSPCPLNPEARIPKAKRVALVEPTCGQSPLC